MTRAALLCSRAVLALYPRGFRERYGEELLQLTEDLGPGAAGAWDLLRGVARARRRGRLQRSEPRALETYGELMPRGGGEGPRPA